MGQRPWRRRMAIPPGWSLCDTIELTCRQCQTTYVVRGGRAKLVVHDLGGHHLNQEDNCDGCRYGLSSGFRFRCCTGDGRIDRGTVHITFDAPWPPERIPEG